MLKKQKLRKSFSTDLPIKILRHFSDRKEEVRYLDLHKFCHIEKEKIEGK